MLFICQSINQVPRGAVHRNIGIGCHIPAIAVLVALPTPERHGGSFRGASLYWVLGRHSPCCCANTRPDDKTQKPLLLRSGAGITSHLREERMSKGPIAIVAVIPAR